MKSLVDYYISSSDESGDEIDICPEPKRIRLEENNSKTKSKIEPYLQPLKKKLPPLPASFLSKFENKSVHTDDPSAHSGRVRSFKHEIGNWATFVSIQYPHEISEILLQVVSRLSPIAKFFCVEDLHLSVSRTVTILHHWIGNLTDDLKKQIVQSNCKTCKLTIGNVEVYCNDERTRTFIGLTLNHDELFNYVKAVDKSFNQFLLPPFYEVPRFHVSLAWCVGDLTSELNSEVLDDLMKLIEEYFMVNSKMKHFEVNDLRLKTGNKVFRLSLPS